MLVIGNGESRLGINLDEFDVPKIGCNAIYRDFFTDHLVCVDKRMCDEALNAEVNHKSLIYTRPENYISYTKRLREVPLLPYAGMERPDQPKHWGSGPYALLIAAKKYNTISMVGFDLYSQTKNVNNIYKGTKNYIAAEKSAVDPSYWIYQISKIFENFTTKEFIIYQVEGWKRPKSWKKPNVKVDNISNIYYNINYKTRS